MNAPELLTALFLRPFALAAAAWLLLRIFGIRHPASKHAVWTAVLIATLLLPPLTLLTPKLTLRILPAKPVPGATIPIASETNITEPAIPSGIVPEPPTPPAHRNWPASQTLIIGLYLTGLIAMLAYRLIAWILLRKIMSSAKRIHRFVYQSNDVLTPATCGVQKPTIILPADWRTWPTETRRAALAHEYAHIRRHDTLTLALTRFATTIYWFHPLTWWLSRQISDQAELSCDAAVLEKSGDAKQYSRILLTFAEQVTAAQHRIALPRLTFASASGMSQRIDKIFELSGSDLRKLARPGLFLALSGLPLTALIAAVSLGAPEPKPILIPTAPQPITAPTITPPAKLLAQSTTPPPPSTPKPEAPPTPAQLEARFEAASIRENPGPWQVLRGYSASGSRLTLEGWRVSDLIEEAWNLKRYNLSTLPPSTNDLVFNIAAKAEGDGARTKEEFRPLLQKLLVDRFHLQLHRETREIPVYAMVIGKSGPKFHESETSEPSKWYGGVDGRNQYLELQQATMEQLADGIPGFLFTDRPVIDKTGLTGKYDIRLEATPGFRINNNNPQPDDLSVFDAIQQQLGLRLEPQKASVEITVVDHVEKPTEN